MARNVVQARLESEEFSTEDLQLRTLVGREAISQLFSYELELVGPERMDLDLETVVGASATLVFAELPSAGELDQIVQESLDIRRVHGMIAEITALSTNVGANHRAYRMRLVPRAFRLTLVHTQEIFLEESIPDIIRHKLERIGLTREDYELRLLGTYPELPFVVQYRETDLAFLSRITQHLGISFYVEHDEGLDKIIFSDHNAGFRPIEGESHVAFRGGGEKREVYELELTRKMIPRMVVLQEYNHKTPQVDLTVVREIDSGNGGGTIEYGAHYGTPEEGEVLARIRAQELLSTQNVYSGTSDVCRWRVGATFTLKEHPWIETTEFVILNVEHRLTQVVLLHGGGDGEYHYNNSFRAIDKRVTYRPARVTPKPRIHGLIPGLVEPNPDGTLTPHARIDEQGDYTIRLFFDTSALGARSRSSLPIRMLQAHAGPHYGIHFPLKPGIEVQIAFLDGDPDRPFIVGSVPNPITPSPVVRKNSTMNRIQTVSGILIEMKDE